MHGYRPTHSAHTDRIEFDYLLWYRGIETKFSTHYAIMIRSQQLRLSNYRILAHCREYDLQI